MALDSPHPLYKKSTEGWRTMDDVLGGDDKVKAAGVRYLPMLVNDEPEDYEPYKLRASFFNATGRTQAALIGFLFRKDPVIKPDEKAVQKNQALSGFMNDATLRGKSFYDITKEVADRVTGKARLLSIVDWSKEESRPFVLLYEAEDVINWRYERINGKIVLSMLVLHELDPRFIDIGDGEKPSDEYEFARYDQWRVWRIKRDPDGQPYVVITVWRRRKTAGGKNLGPTRQEPAPNELKGTGPAPGAGVTGTDDFVQIEGFQPKRGLFPLQLIPATFHGPDGPDGDIISVPPLLDMARINLSHYRTTADLENALHVIGVPTPWAAGFTDEQTDELVLGTTTAWTTDDPQAQCGFLELSGTGLKNLTDALERKSKQMAQLGARMLAEEAQGRGNAEAFATVALRQTGETAVLMKISLSISQTVTHVLSWAIWWTSPDLAVPMDAEKDGACQVTLNTDFLGGVMDSATMTSLMALYIQGGISFESLFAKFQAGEVIPADRTIEQERAFIEKGQSTLMQFTNPPPPIDPNKPQPEPGAKPARNGDGGISQGDAGTK